MTLAHDCDKYYGYGMTFRCSVCKCRVAYTPEIGWGYVHGSEMLCSYPCLLKRIKKRQQTVVKMTEIIGGGQRWNKAWHDKINGISFLINDQSLTDADRLEKLREMYGDEWYQHELHLYGRNCEGLSPQMTFAIIIPQSLRNDAQKELVTQYRRKNELIRKKRQRDEIKCQRLNGLSNA